MFFVVTNFSRVLTIFLLNFSYVRLETETTTGNAGYAISDYQRGKLLQLKAGLGLTKILSRVTLAAKGGSISVSLALSQTDAS